MSDVRVPANLLEWIGEHLRRYLESDGADGHMWDSSPDGGPGLVPTLLLTEYRHLHSGDGPFFYITDIHGNHTQSVRIKGFDASSADFEDISIGPCSADKSCLFIGDIGDNFTARETIHLLVIEEKGEYVGPVVPLHKVI